MVEGGDIDLMANTGKDYSTIVLSPRNINDDGIVNVQDLGHLLGGFNKTETKAKYEEK